MSVHDPEDTYNRGGFIAFIFTMVFSFVFFAYVSFFHPGVDLEEVPEDMGGEQAEASPLAAIDKPWEPNEDMVAHGAKVYQQNCASCHGQDGKANTPTGRAVNARDLVKGDWQKGGTSIALYKTLQEGITGTSMASFQSALKPFDRWAVTQYVRSITENKVEDDMDALAEFAQSAD